MKKFAMILIAVLLCVALTGCQTQDGAKVNGNAAATAELKAEATAEPTTEPTEEPAAEFVALDWENVEECAAENFTYEFFDALDPDTYDEITGVRLLTYTGSDAIVKVPDTIEGCMVREADAKQLFKGNTVITHVSLPANLRAYAKGYDLSYLFQGCTSLQQVQMPMRCSQISGRMFDGCTSLRLVEFAADEAHPVEVRKIGIGAFAGCTALTEIELPESVAEVWDQAFSGCVSLESFRAHGAKMFGSEVFADCGKLTNVEICAAIDGMGWQVSGMTFRNCTALESITLVETEDAAGATSKPVFENGALYLIDSYDPENVAVALLYLPIANSETAVLRDDIVEIASHAMDGCTFRELTIPASVMKIKNNAIVDCPNLEVIRLAEGSKLRSVWYSVSDCKALTTIDLSNADAEAAAGFTLEFDYCPNLENIIMPE